MYRSERVNDFFLLHGVTGAWSLCQILPHLKPKDGLIASRMFLVALLTTYIIMGCPALTGKPDDYFCAEVNDQHWKGIAEKVTSHTW